MMVKELKMMGIIGKGGKDTCYYDMEEGYLPNKKGIFA